MLSSGRKIADIHYTETVWFLCADSCALLEYHHGRMICYIFHIYTVFHPCEFGGEFYVDCLVEILNFKNLGNHINLK